MLTLPTCFSALCEARSSALPYTLSFTTYSFLWYASSHQPTNQAASTHAQVWLGHEHPQEMSNTSGAWEHTAIISAFGRLSQEDPELEDSMGHTVRCRRKSKHVNKRGHPHGVSHLHSCVAGPNYAVWAEHSTPSTLLPLGSDGGAHPREQGHQPALLVREFPSPQALPCPVWICPPLAGLRLAG